VGEINRSLIYYQTREDGSKVDRLFLCGGASEIEGLRETISGAVGIEVDQWDPLDGVSIDSSRFDSGLIERLRTFMPLAVALAMKSDPR
jgi:Tfp pilus assembly PilM family ATPase